MLLLYVELSFELHNTGDVCKETLFCAFSRALRKRWIDLVSAAMEDGRRRAIEIEKLYWAKHQAAVRVTPSGKITDSQGKELMPIAINAVTDGA
jgi:hypothetical protein